MSDTDFELLSKKVDKLLNLTTKIGKALHLIPVTEKEEEALQLLQRKNLQVAATVNHKLNVMENKSDEGDSTLEVSHILEENEAALYDGIIGDDIISSEVKTK